MATPRIASRASEGLKDMARRRARRGAGMLSAMVNEMGDVGDECAGRGKVCERGRSH